MTASGFVHRKAKALIGFLAALMVVVGVVTLAPADLVLQYTFDQKATPPDTLAANGIHDRSGHGNDGSVITATDAMFVNGPSGNPNAIHLTKDDAGDEFSGSGITTNTDTMGLGVDTGPFTLTAWVNRDNQAGDNMIFGTPPPGDGSLHVGFRGDTGYFAFWGNDSQGGTIPTGEWHHLAYRYNFDVSPPFSKGQQDIFIDGILVSRSGGHRPYAKTRTQLIGRTVANNGAFGGSLSDVRIYNEFLTDAAIIALAGSPP